MPTGPSIGLVTCRVLPEPDPDQQLMLNLLAAAGLDAALIPWDDADIDPANHTLLILRSCWNYHEHPDDFLEWCRRAASATRLRNPLELVEWNLHKRYLTSLESAGLPVVPTVFVSRGERPSLGEMLTNCGWTDVVIKPCISAGSANTRRFRDAPSDPGADAFLNSIALSTDAMIQPFIQSVETGGERSAVWIGDEATHAIVKQPRFHDDDESVSDAVDITPEEHALRDAIRPLLPAEPLYARLDTMRSRDGSLLISEVELIEPSLFLLQSERAQRAFVRAIAGALGEPAL
ncbi:MAG: hypothetical protein AAGH71_04055 [Planctomycetota bacterium]